MEWGFEMVILALGVGQQSPCWTMRRPIRPHRVALGSNLGLADHVKNTEATPFQSYQSLPAKLTIVRNINFANSS